MIVKVAKSIGEDPALFLKSPEEIEKMKNYKKKYFESLDNGKSIANIVLSEFMKELNPYEIIFKPDKVSSNQLMLK